MMDGDRPLNRLGPVPSRPLDQLRHEVRFGCDLIPNINCAAHFADAPPYGIEQFHLEDHRVTRNDLVFEFAIVDLDEIGIVFTLRHGIDTKDASGLGQRLYLQDAGHYGIPGEMTYEKGFVEGNVLDPDDSPVR